MKKYIFIHDLHTNKIKVISSKNKKDWIGKYIHNDTYTMFFSKDKKFICDCPHNVYCKNDFELCNHRKRFLELFLDLYEKVKTEKWNIVFHVKTNDI